MRSIFFAIAIAASLMLFTQIYQIKLCKKCCCYKLKSQADVKDYNQDIKFLCKRGAILARTVGAETKLLCLRGYK